MRRSYSLLLTATLVQLFAWMLAHFFIKSTNPLIVIGAQLGLVFVLTTILVLLKKIPLWWIWIQVFFLLAVYLIQQWQIPPVFFLLAFFVSLLFYYAVLLSRIPYYPSSKVVWQSVEDYIYREQKISPNFKLVDIGSGFGGLSLYLAKRNKTWQVDGVELAPLLWLFSYLRSRLSQSSAHFIYSDFRKINLAAYDVVFAYLSPVAMPSLWQQAKTQMHQGSLLMSYEFAVPDVVPFAQLSIAKKMDITNTLFIYQL